MDAKKEEFHKRMCQLTGDWLFEIKKTFPMVNNMLTHKRGHEIAIKLVSEPDPSTGFLAICKADRPDLTIEAEILKEEWEGLFLEDLKVIARQKLEPYLKQ